MKSEMSLGYTRMRSGIETAPVVVNGKDEAVVFQSALDIDGGRVSVVEGIGGEFPDDAQDRMVRMPTSVMPRICGTMTFDRQLRWFEQFPNPPCRNTALFQTRQP